MHHHPSYQLAVDLIREFSRDDRPVLIAIDGRPAAGKSTLARYLAWTFNISHIETDQFLKRGHGALLYQNVALKNAIEHGAAKSRPFIVDGVNLLRLLTKLKIKHDLLIYVMSDQSHVVDHIDEYVSYDTEFAPSFAAHICLDLTPIE